MTKGLSLQVVRRVGAFRAHLVADGPFGALLSGCMDSSLLVAMSKKELEVPIETFTERFGERQYDESPHARMVAHPLGLIRRQVPVLGGVAAPLEQIHEILDQFDQSVADSSAISTFFASRGKRKHVKVAIGGGGGDEVFGGHPRLFDADVGETLGGLPSAQRGGLNLSRCSLTGPALDSASKLVGSPRRRRMTIRQRLMDLSCANHLGQLPMTLSEEVSREVSEYLPDMGSTGTLVERWTEDRWSMRRCRMRSKVTTCGRSAVASPAHGLEVHVQFMGDRVLQLSPRLPDRLKYRGRRRGKRLLRCLLREYVLDGISKRHKAGFSIPLATYLGDESRKAVAAMVVAPGARVGQFIADADTSSVIGGFVDRAWSRARWSRDAASQPVFTPWDLKRWLQMRVRCLAPGTYR